MFSCFEMNESKSTITVHTTKLQITILFKELNLTELCLHVKFVPRSKHIPSLL